MGWNSEEVDFTIRERGIKHTYSSNTKSYIAVAYPVVLGELKHIYQNGLYNFDLLPDFEVKIIEREGKEYYFYKFPEKMASGEDVFEFLWKDKNI